MPSVCPTCGLQFKDRIVYAQPLNQKESMPIEVGSESEFKIKDSGERAQFSGGMVRDVATNKTDYTLILDGPMFDRWAVHLTNGAKKYAKRNWMKAEGQEEMDRFKESALRHFIQWFKGEIDEDHAAAVYFNINGYETTKGKQKDPQS